MRLRRLLSLLPMLGLISLGFEAQAATITLPSAPVVNSTQSGVAGGPVSFTGYNTGSTTDQSLLLVMVSGERTHVGTGASPVGSVTFAGQALTEIGVVGTNTAGSYATIWALANPNAVAGQSVGDILVTMVGSGNGYMAAALTLHSTEQIIWFPAVTAEGGNVNSVSLNHPARGQSDVFLLETYERNFVASTTITRPADSTQIYTYNANNGGGYATYAGYTEHFDATLAASRAYGISTTATTRSVALGMMFSTVPEPSHAMLVSLGVAGLVYQRRRRW